MSDLFDVAECVSQEMACVSLEDVNGSGINYLAAKALGRRVEFFDDWFRSKDDAVSAEESQARLAQQPLRGQWVCISGVGFAANFESKFAGEKATPISAYTSNPTDAWMILTEHIFRVEDLGHKWVAEAKDGVTAMASNPMFACVKAFVKFKHGEQVNVPSVFVKGLG